MSFLPASMSIPHAGTSLVLSEVRRGHHILWKWSYRWFEAPHVSWELNPSRLGEQPVL